MRMFTNADIMDDAEIGDHYYGISSRSLYRKIEAEPNRPWACVAQGDVAEQIYHQLLKGIALDAARENNDTDYGAF